MNHPSAVEDNVFVCTEISKSCKFKYDDIHTAADLFHKDDWFFKFDYKLEWLSPHQNISSVSQIPQIFLILQGTSKVF